MARRFAIIVALGLSRRKILDRDEPLRDIALQPHLDASTVGSSMEPGPRPLSGDVMSAIEASSSLIADIHDAAFAPPLWTSVLENATKYIGGSGASLWIRNPVGTGPSQYYYFGVDDCGRELVFAACRGSRAPAEPAPSDDTAKLINPSTCVPPPKFFQMRFYEELATPPETDDKISGLGEESKQCIARFAVFCCPWDKAARRRMQLIAPHIRRGVLIGRRHAYQMAAATEIADTLDGLRVSIFLVDANGWIVHANTSGYAMLTQASLLRSVKGKLTATGSDADAPLSKGIAQAAHHDAALHIEATAIPLTSANGQPYLMHVLPLASGSRKARVDAVPRAVTALIVHEAAMSIAEPAGRIANHYGLAPRERDVLRSIVESDGLAEVAEKLAIAESTVKTHLRRVFEKTGTCRQVELIKLCAAFSNPFLGQSSARQ